MSEEIQQAPEQQPASLSLADLMGAVQAIQVAAKRGAFDASEFAIIGASFDKLVSFLEANGAITRTPAGASNSDESASQES